MKILEINKEYIDTKGAQKLLDVSERVIQKTKHNYEYITKQGKTGQGCKLLFKTESIINSLSPEKRLMIYKRIGAEELAQRRLQEDEINLLTEQPRFKTTKAKKYLAMIESARGYSGKDLEIFIKQWNEKYPEYKTSLKSYYRALKKYKDEGAQSLLAGYGKNKDLTKIEPSDYEYFYNLYMKEGGPTLKSCWLETYGNAVKRNYGAIPENFPSMSTFYNQLTKRVPVQSVKRVRKGERYWNKRYAVYADRDWSGIRAGQCWFSDHRQADQAVMRMLPDGEEEQIKRLTKFEGNSKSKPVFPWITFWADAKTRKMLSIYVHEDAPDSDDIFYSFKLAIEKYGVPAEIYIDNGKDYRCKEFAGGKKKRKLELDEVNTQSLMNRLGVAVHFSRPYRGQSKTIERSFRVMKEWLDKQMPGYRGGNITERPEKLQAEIKGNKIMDITEYSEILNFFWNNVFNKYESEGKLNGESADQVWAKEFKVRKTVSEDALRLLCMRSSKSYTIGRNGINISTRYNLHYYADWMESLKGNGERYYMRRDIEKFQIAYIFDSKNDTYMGTAELNVWKTAALAKTDLEKEQLKKVLQMQSATKKNVDSYIPDVSYDPREILENLALGISLTSRNIEQEQKEDLTIYMRTDFDEVKQIEEDYQRTGTYGLDEKYLPKIDKKAMIFTSLIEKEEYERSISKNKKADHNE
jgi:hypothetical protein